MYSIHKLKKKKKDIFGLKASSQGRKREREITPWSFNFIFLWVVRNIEEPLH